MSGATFMEYNPIATEFKKNGFNYRQIVRQGDWAIYEQSKPTISRSWFEVVNIGRHDGYEVRGQRIEPAETYPPSESWGKRGFTCWNLDDALKKLESASNQPSKPLEFESGNGAGGVLIHSEGQDSGNQD